MTENRPSKKTETLEVRMPPETKLALKEKAALEGRTVSETIRQLIDTYLMPVKEVTPSPVPKGVIMSLPKPHIIAAIIAAFCSLSLFTITPSRAQNVELQLKTDIVKSEMKDGGIVSNSSTTEAVMVLAPDEIVTIETGKETGKAYMMSLSLETIDDDRFRLTMKITDGDGIIAAPTLEAHYGSNARVQIGEQLEDGTPFDMITIDIIGERKL